MPKPVITISITNHDIECIDVPDNLEVDIVIKDYRDRHMSDYMREKLEEDERGKFFQFPYHP